MTPAMQSELEESNRQFLHAWRGFAASLGDADLSDLPGLAVAWPNAALPFYNVVFLSAPAAGASDFEERAQRAFDIMQSKAQPGMFVVCEEWLPAGVRESAPAGLAAIGLQPAMALTGMVADELLPPLRPLPRLEYRRVDSQETRDLISDINSYAYGLPPGLGRASIALERAWTADCYGHIAYVDGRAVASSGTFPTDGRLYVGLVATLPDLQRRGYAEAVMRHSLQEAAQATGLRRTTLHATAAGRPVYLRMGYRETARFTAYVPAAH